MRTNSRRQHRKWCAIEFVFTRNNNNAATTHFRAVNNTLPCSGTEERHKWSGAGANNRLITCWIFKDTARDGCAVTHQLYHV